MKKRGSRRKRQLRELIAEQKADRKRDIALTRYRSPMTKTSRHKDEQ